MSRLSKALNSDDLMHREQDCDVDVLRATGSTALHRNLGVLILEAKEGAAGDGPHAVARIKDLEQALERRIKSIAQRWKVRVDITSVSQMVVRELILDRCYHCQGRGFIPMKYDGQRMVAVVGDDEGAKDVDCHVCFGSGSSRRDYDGRALAAGWDKYTKQLAEWWEAVLQSCCDAEMSARRMIWLKLRNNTR